MMRINCISAFNLMAIGVDIFMWFLVLGGLSMCFPLYYLPRDYLNMLGIYWYPFSIVVDKSYAFNDIELGKKITCLFKKKHMINVFFLLKIVPYQVLILSLIILISLLCRISSLFCVNRSGIRHSQPHVFGLFGIRNVWNTEEDTL